MKEIWKDVLGYEGLYWISNYGRVKSIRVGIRKTRPKSNKYIIIDLYHNNISKTKHVHRLVAIAFIPNPNNLPTVNHKDGNKHNNIVSNLEWMSYSNNNKHALLLKLRQSPFKIHNNEIIFIKRLIKFGFTQTEISTIYNVKPNTISALLRFREDK